MGDFIKPDYPLKQDLYKNKENLERIRKKVEAFPLKDVFFGVCTGRSFYQADSIMKITGHQGPSIFEMGNVIFDPEEGVYNLFERHEKFAGNVEVVRDFIIWKNEMKQSEETIKEKFPNSNIRQMKDRSCMLTYEFENDIGKELLNHLFGIMPQNIKEAIEKGVLKVLISKKAIDILPNLSKGDAVTYLAGKYNINKEEILAIGDSSHSDLDLLKSAGLIACPDNADEELKKFVIKNNGFLVPNNSHEGLLNIFDLVENFIKFKSMKNGIRVFE